MKGTDGWTEQPIRGRGEFHWEIKSEVCFRTKMFWVDGKNQCDSYGHFDYSKQTTMEPDQLIRFLSSL